MSDLDELFRTPKPTAARPLLGSTILVVDDSRFSAEAIRLLCLRSGARLRRADGVRTARRHLRNYRPDVIIIDHGLPDGSGADLVAELVRSTPRIPAVLSFSGDPDGASRAEAAGADGFLEKPVKSIAGFQAAVLACLPPERHPKGPRISTEETITPDAVALRDDLHRSLVILEGPVTERGLDYVVQFLSTLARSAEDGTLAAATSEPKARASLGHDTGRERAALSDLLRRKFRQVRPI